MRAAVAQLSAPRIDSVDAVRGLVMIIMALDHVRDFFHSGAMVFPPEDLTRTWPALFFTRWITHICAPAFMLLAGVSAALWQSRRERTKGDLSRHLLTRGLWLILLELVFLRFAFFLNLTSAPFMLTVLWALGMSMIALAALIHLPRGVLAAVCIAGIALHNLTDPVAAQSLGAFGWLWHILHQPGPVGAVGGLPIFLMYPLVPWIFVMTAGYWLAPLVSDRRFLIRTGVLLSAAFLAIRAVNVYGDPRPWSTALHPVLSFLNTNKYPPSLLYLLMTLGPVLILLGVFRNVRLSRNNPLLVYGQVPLFYFLGHFMLSHLLAFPVAQFWYGRSAFLLEPLPSVGGSATAYPPDFGYPLWFTYLMWALVVLLMYPACRWYRDRALRRPALRPVRVPDTNPATQMP